jgi:hypothetical protein
MPNNLFYPLLCSPTVVFPRVPLPSCRTPFAFLLHMPLASSSLLIMAPSSILHGSGGDCLGQERLRPEPGFGLRELAPMAEGGHSQCAGVRRHRGPMCVCVYVCVCVCACVYLCMRVGFCA